MQGFSYAFVEVHKGPFCIQANFLSIQHLSSVNLSIQPDVICKHDFVLLSRPLMKILNSISSNMKTWKTLLVTCYQNLFATAVLKTKSPT